MLQRELASLRKGTGLTSTRWEECRTLKEVLAASMVPAEQLTFKAARERLTALVRESCSPRDAHALLNAWAVGIGPFAETVGERRRDFAKTLRSSRSAKTIENWENVAIEEVARRLLVPGVEVAALEVYRSRDPNNIAATGLIPAAIHERPYVYEFTEHIWRFGPNRVPKEALVTKVIRAAADGVDSYFPRYYYVSDLRPGVVRTEAVFDCSVENAEYSPTGVLQAHIRLPQSLNAGNSHRFSYRITIDSSKPAVPRLRSLAIATRERAIYRVQFDKDALPLRIWRFEGLLDVETPGMPTQENSLKLNKVGCVEWEWSHPKRYLYYGLAWRW